MLLLGAIRTVAELGRKGQRRLENSVDFTASSSFLDRKMFWLKLCLTAPVSRQILGLCTGEDDSQYNQAGDAFGGEIIKAKTHSYNQ